MVTENISESQKRLKLENKIDFAIKMRDAALLSSDRRQVYEWKFSILIWTAFGSIIATLLINKSKIHLNDTSFWLLLLFSTIIMAVVIYFQYYCHLANQVDKRRAELYETLINASMEITYKNDHSNSAANPSKVDSGTNNNVRLANKIKELDTAIDSIKGNRGRWSRISQVLITAVLIATFWVVCFSIQDTKQETQSFETPINTTNP